EVEGRPRNARGGGPGSLGTRGEAEQREQRGQGAGKAWAGHGNPPLAKVRLTAPETELPSHLFGSSAIVGSFVACEVGVAEEVRTRGFVPPAFAGFTFVAVALLAALLAGTDLQRGHSSVNSAVAPPHPRQPQA